MNAEQQAFVKKYAADAIAAGKRFKINPLVILAQAAHESAWGTSYSAQHRHNLFGVLATKATSEFWHGKSDKSKAAPYLTFRVYDSDADSIMDFARLIASRYPVPLAVSYQPAQYAAAIAASPYISERNGDSRPAYAAAVRTNSASIAAYAKQANIAFA